MRIHQVLYPFDRPILTNRTRLPFKDRRKNAGIGAIFLLYAAIYLKDWASQWSNGTAAIVALAIGLMVGCWSLVMRGSKASPIDRSSMLIMAIFSAVWVLSFLAKGVVNMSSYYIAIPCAFLIVNLNFRRFIQILLAHLLINLLIAAVEYFSGQYFFIYQADDGTVLDETLFGGMVDVFRAKGMFQGPLSAVAFALWMAFLVRGSIPVGVALFLCAFFASGRLGMLTSSVLIGFRLLQGSARAVYRKLPWLLCIVVTASLLFAFSDENRLLFITKALDTENEQNMSRTYIWLSSFAYYLTYGPLDLLFGNYGFIFKQEGATENDFLRLLLDCGLVGFGLYAGAIFSLIIRAIRRRDREDLLIAFLIIGLMNIFPFVQSLSSSVLFWVYFFVTMNRSNPVLWNKKELGIGV